MKDFLTDGEMAEFDKSDPDFVSDDAMAQMERDHQSVFSRAADKVKALPGALADTASEAAKFGKRVVTGDVSPDEAMGRAATAIRGAGDVALGAGAAGINAVNHLFGSHETLDLPTDHATQRIASMFDSGDVERMKKQDASYPGARATGEMIPALALPQGSLASIGASAIASSGAHQLADTGAIDLKETVSDGLAGMVPGAAMKVASQASKVLPKAGKFAASKIADLPEETVDYYLKNNEAVKAARPLNQVAKSVNEGLDNGAKKVSELSTESYEILGRNQTALPKAQLKEMIDGQIAAMKDGGIFTGDAKRDLLKLSIISKSLEAAKGEAEGATIGGAKLKNLLRQVDDSIERLKGKRSGEIPTELERRLVSFRGQADNAVKSVDEDYAQHMVKTADAANALSAAKPFYSTQDGAFGSLRAVANPKNLGGDQGAALFRREALDKLDGLIGSDLVKEARDSGVQDAFRKSTTNGSRNTNLGGFGGMAAGGPLGGAIGATMGYLKDSLARPATAKALDVVAAIKPLTPRLGKYAKPLLEAAKRGPAQVLLVHNLLSRDPEYRRLAEEE